MLKGIINMKNQKIKVFMPSKGKTMTKVAKCIDEKYGYKVMVLVEDLNNYGETLNGCHTLLLPDMDNVYHFSFHGGQLEMFKDIEFERLYEFLKDKWHAKISFELKNDVAV